MPSHCETQPVEHRLLGCGSDESDPVRVADFNRPLARNFQRGGSDLAAWKALSAAQRPLDCFCAASDLSTAAARIPSRSGRGVSASHRSAAANAR